MTNSVSATSDTQQPAHPNMDETPRRRFTLPTWTGAAIALALLIAYTCYYQATHGDHTITFLKPLNLLNILERNAPLGLLAIGMTLAVVLGGIDLSVGSLMAFAGAMGVLVLNRLQPPTAGSAIFPVLMCALVAVAIGLGAGLVNGVVIAKGRVAPFIATLAGLLAFRSAAQWLANGGQVTAAGGATWFKEIGGGFPIPGTNVSNIAGRIRPLEVPYSILVWFIVALFAAILLYRTRLGRYIIAIGSNERAARYSAISVDRVKIATYSLLGMIAGLAGLLDAANYTSVNTSQAGLYLELYAIAAVVIGGTRMEGGAGSIFGTIVGVILLGVIKNTMVMLGVNTYAQGIATGSIIVAAVLVQRVWGRRGS